MLGAPFLAPQPGRAGYSPALAFTHARGFFVGPGAPPAVPIDPSEAFVPSDIDELMVTIQDVREYFPEYRGRRFIGSLASLYADDSLISFATRKGIIILAVGEELMDVMNEPGFKPEEFCFLR